MNDKETAKEIRNRASELEETVKKLRQQAEKIDNTSEDVGQPSQKKGVSKQTKPDWLDKHSKDYQDMLKSKRLNNP